MMTTQPDATNDTSAEAEEVQLELIRAMSPSERSERAIRLTTQVREMAREAIRRQHPESSEERVGIKLLEVHYGKELAREVEQYLASRNRA